MQYNTKGGDFKIIIWLSAEITPVLINRIESLHNIYYQTLWKISIKQVNNSESQSQDEFLPVLSLSFG